MCFTILTRAIPGCYVAATAAAIYSTIQYYADIVRVWGLHAVDLLCSSYQPAREFPIPRRVSRPRLSVAGLFFSAAAGRRAVLRVVGLWPLGFWVIRFYGVLSLRSLRFRVFGSEAAQKRRSPKAIGLGLWALAVGWCSVLGRLLSVLVILLASALGVRLKFNHAAAAFDFWLWIFWLLGLGLRLCQSVPLQGTTIHLTSITVRSKHLCEKRKRRNMQL